MSPKSYKVCHYAIIKTDWKFEDVRIYNGTPFDFVAFESVTKQIGETTLVQSSMIKNPSTSYIHYFYEHFYFTNLCLVLFVYFVFTEVTFLLDERGRMKENK